MIFASSANPWEPYASKGKGKPVVPEAGYYGFGLALFAYALVMIRKYHRNK